MPSYDNQTYIDHHDKGRKLRERLYIDMTDDDHFMQWGLEEFNSDIPDSPSPYRDWEMGNTWRGHHRAPRQRLLLPIVIPRGTNHELAMSDIE